MTKNDKYIVRSGRTGLFVTMPSGKRVHALDRAVFNRAIDAANTRISNDRPKTVERDLPRIRSVRNGEPA